MNQPLRSPGSPREPSWLKALGILAAAYFALWACAPTMTIPPGSPLDRPGDTSLSLGASINGPEQWAIYAEPTPTQSGAARGALADAFPRGEEVIGYKLHLFPDAQLSLLHQSGEKLQWGVTLGGGYTSLVMGGGLVRYILHKDDRVWVAVEAQGGWMWAGAALPFRLRLTDALSVYTSPTVAAGVYRARIPLGFSVRLGDHGALHAEVAGHMLSPNLGADAQTNLYGYRVWDTFIPSAALTYGYTF